MSTTIATVVRGAWRRRATVTLLCAALTMAAMAAAPTQTATATVTPAALSIAPPSDSNGYAWVSYFRGLAGLGGVTRNAALEAGEAVHVRYLANHALACETNVHDELTSRVGNCGANPYATAAGKAAANNSNVTRVSVNVSDRTAVSNWFGAAFHALVLLDPRLNSTGYASYYTPKPTGAKPLAWNYTAAVDVYRGRGGGYNGGMVVFPANNAVTPVLSYAVGTEAPEPFQTSVGGCRSWGSRPVVSAPVIVQWPLRAARAAGQGTLMDLTTGRPQPTCTLNASSYPSGSEGRVFLAGTYGITKSAFYYALTPFVAGHRYQLRVGGAALTTFTAGALPTAAAQLRAAGARGAVALSWSAAASGTGAAARYAARAYASPNCSGALVAAADTSATQATLRTFVRGRYYGIRVATLNSVGGSRWSGCLGIRAN